MKVLIQRIFIFKPYAEAGMTQDNRWKAHRECKRSGNKYGKPTECCGDTFPDVMPLQQVSMRPYLSL